jgi:adenylate cyclase
LISRLAKGALLGAAAGIVGSAASLTPFGLDLEQNHGLGILFRLRGQRTPPQDVVVVSIDKESADNLDLDDDVKNWPRSLHARLTENLAEKGASVIAFDVFFEEPTERGEDLAFAEAMRKANNVLLGERQQSEKLVLTGMKGKPGGEIEIARRIPPVPLLADASVATTPFPLPKVPIKVNWGWTFRKTAEDAPTPTLPVVAFQMYSLSAYGDFLGLLEKVFPEQAKGLPRSGEEVAGSRGVVGMIREVREIFESAPSAKERMLHMLDSSPSNPADPERRRILRSLIHLYGGGIRKFLNFYGPIQTIPTIPYYRALKIGGKGKGDPSPAEVAGKAVFIGSSESRQLAQKDGFYTVYTTENGVDLSGVEIQATVFANLVEDMPVRPLPFRFHVATLFLWGLGVGILSIIFRPAVSIPAVTALSLMYLGAAEYRFAAAFAPWRGTSSR